ncbi:hypothetical protein [Bradyrhizobium manausense]|uniref:Uncharacterized protein n=1 Tax=Bradyrhizobium manausense TaxID=989370 RepID=A0A0R3E2L9_9BRAD|nr:hypothetical protein [Bradyrhizobium manausense]KRQ16336.1 hypothetical protein AOQ71_05025 [Bradyrhizobium manausense]
MYRYSTTRGNILKSFIVIQKPRGQGHTDTFNHFVWPREEAKIKSFRECEGFVLKFDKAFYFIGYNYEVKEIKRLYLGEYLKKRSSSKLNPNGLGLITTEYDSRIEKRG